MPLNLFANYLQKSQLNMEDKLRENYNINTENWFFSSDNIMLLEKIINLLEFVTFELKEFSKYQIYKYLKAFSALQKISKIFKPDLVFNIKNSPYYVIKKVGFRKKDDLIIVNNNEKTISEFLLENKNNDSINNKEEFNKINVIKEECIYYSIFANGSYGDLFNNIMSGKNVSKIFNYQDFDVEFLNHIKQINGKCEILYRQWEAKPFYPAFCFVNDKEKKNIILCLRGSRAWGDYLTDLIFLYLKVYFIFIINIFQFFILFNLKIFSISL